VVSTLQLLGPCVCYMSHASLTTLYDQPNNESWRIKIQRPRGLKLVQFCTALTHRSRFRNLLETFIFIRVSSLFVPLRILDIYLEMGRSHSYETQPNTNEQGSQVLTRRIEGSGPRLPAAQCRQKSTKQGAFHYLILPVAVTSSLLSPNIILSNVFSDTFFQQSSFKTRDQVPHSRWTTVRIIVSCFPFLYLYFKRLLLNGRCHFQVL
jgi:hypothetical protein